MLQTFKKTMMALMLSTTLGLTACATTQSDYVEGDVYDPWESYNRSVFSFNDGLDTILLNPITEAYRFVVPDAFRTAISNVLTNLKSPVYLANELLQGDMDDALIVTQRFVFNTFTGFGGILDTASWEGIDYVPEDFGQTLAVWGIESGPYMVLPIFGPSTVRDTFGLGGDMLLDPINWYAWNTDNNALLYGRTAVTALVTKDQYYDLQKDLKANSLDYYAAVRSISIQRRMALINDNAISDESAYDDFE